MKKVKTIFGDTVKAYAVVFNYSDKAKALEYFTQFVNQTHVVVSDISIEPNQQSAIFRIVTIGGIKYFKSMLPMECEEFGVELHGIEEETKTVPVNAFELNAINYLFCISHILEAELNDFLGVSGRYAQPQEEKDRIEKEHGDVEDMLAAIRKRRAELKEEEYATKMLDGAHARMEQARQMNEQGELK